MKNSAIAFFFEGRNAPKVWWTFMEPLFPKKIKSQVLLSVACYRCELSIIHRMTKKKLKKNIAGLWNQSKPASQAPDDSTEAIEDGRPMLTWISHQIMMREHLKRHWFWPKIWPIWTARGKKKLRRCVFRYTEQGSEIRMPKNWLVADFSCPRL